MIAAGRKRWDSAQAYEREHWKRIAGKIAEDPEKQLTWYGWKANELEKKLNEVSFKFNKDSSKVLEIGSGPIGIVSYLKWGERYTLDPLEDFYKENPKLVAVRDKAVNYLTGGGEVVPFADGSISMVIIDNMLDHVLSPDKVLNEIWRVLSKDGMLYIELNIHTAWGFILHRLLAKLKIDKGHPHSFTAGKIREHLTMHRFAVQHEFINDYYQARDRDRSSSSLKDKIKGHTGLSEFIYSAVCFKK